MVTERANCTFYETIKSIDYKQNTNIFSNVQKLINFDALMVINNDTHALGLSAEHCSIHWRKEPETSVTRRT